ncbi:uncharacterized protein EV422DRAFT_51545 [Fimicolochytrium jonesii]|uniref:uncharacterized protein n=1 Tax=Fimicolochytrium jonesii TaxID=1396493 RepID=UPI0022FF1CC6|nr:uncharacterized protein EV422DRAFT_51545 [Fimicolochytrium jonesii]KAI8821074.1 hypothetical protein EV422DRAFT_51545 [Fimicolochytrium jonesii]
MTVIGRTFVAFFAGTPVTLRSFSAHSHRRMLLKGNSAQGPAPHQWGSAKGLQVLWAELNRKCPTSSTPSLLSSSTTRVDIYVKPNAYSDISGDSAVGKSGRAPHGLQGSACKVHVGDVSRNITVTSQCGRSVLDDAHAVFGPKPMHVSFNTPDGYIQYIRPEDKEDAFVGQGPISKMANLHKCTPMDVCISAAVGT